MNKVHHNITKSWYAALARVLLFYCCSVVVLILASTLTKKTSEKIADHLSISIAVVLTFLLIVLFSRWDKIRLIDTGIVPGRKSSLRFLVGFGTGLLMAAGQAIIVFFFGHFQLTLVPEIKPIEILSPLGLYLLIAFREELVFRSYALRSLDNSAGQIFAISVMTTLFILEHVASGMPWLLAIVGSGTGAVLFAVAALKTKGLALPVGLHAAWNFGQWSFGFKNKPGIWKAIVEKGYELKTENIGLAAYVLVMALAITGIAFYHSARQKRSK